MWSIQQFLLVALRLAVICGPPARGLLAFLVGSGCGNCCVQVPNTSTCVFGAAAFYKALVSVHQAGVCIPLYFTVCSCSSAYACSELALVNLCIQRSAVAHMHMVPSCLLQSLGSGLVLHPPLPFLLLHLRHAGLWTVCGQHITVVQAVSMVLTSLMVVGCRRKWAIRGSGSGAMSPSFQAISARRSSSWAWGLMAGLSGFASHQCGLHLGAGCQWWQLQDVLGTQPPQSQLGRRSCLCLFPCINRKKRHSNFHAVGQAYKNNIINI